MKEYIVQANAPETIACFDRHNAPELVRCKYCVHFDDHAIRMHGSEYGECEIIGAIINPQWYCADGEREDDK